MLRPEPSATGSGVQASNGAGVFPSDAMTPVRPRTDDQGYHGEPDEPDINPSAVMQELMRAAMDRAAAAMAHSHALVQRRADDVAQGNSLARPMSERLALADARFRALVSVTGHVMWTADPSGRMLDRQAAWKAFTGQTSLQLQAGDGFGWTEALHPDDRDETVRRFQGAIAAGVPFEHQTRVRHARADGAEWRHMLMRAAPVRNEAGTIVEWVGMNSDVTDFVTARALAEAAERMAREEAEHARDVAESAWHAAEAATAIKARVLAAASHDLRTPLSAITGYTSLLRQEVLGPITEQQRKALTRIGVAGEHLLTLVTDILDAAEVEAGSVRLQLDRVAIRDVCSRLRMLTGPLAEDKGISFSCQTLPESDADRVFVHADRERLLQILVNLVSNAIKFTDAGGAVAVDIFTIDDNVVMQVRDTGCGIAPDQQARIFEPFVQVSNANANANGNAHGGRPAQERGIGLGLATSLELARRMGGNITVESDVGAGATFTLTLPLAR